MYKLAASFCQTEARRFPLLQIKASSSEESSTVDAGELFTDLKAKVRNKARPLLLLKNLLFSAEHEYYPRFSSNFGGWFLSLSLSLSRLASTKYLVFGYHLPVGCT